MAGKKVCVHILISGQVQGIGFRANMRGRASQLGLAGWGKNLNDGRVEAVFEGNEEAVEQMIAWCRQGPFLAEVSAVEIKRKKPQGLTGFEIRR